MYVIMEADRQTNDLKQIKIYCSRDFELGPNSYRKAITVRQAFSL